MFDSCPASNAIRYTHSVIPNKIGVFPDLHSKTHVIFRTLCSSRYPPLPRRGYSICRTFLRYPVCTNVELILWLVFLGMCMLRVTMRRRQVGRVKIRRRRQGIRKQCMMARRPMWVADERMPRIRCKPKRQRGVRGIRLRRLAVGWGWGSFKFGRLRFDRQATWRRKRRA